MHPVRAEKISLLTHTADPQKDSRTNSDLESLLVSSVRYDPTIYYASETQGDSRQHPSRATHHIRSSLIKKNSMSNIVVEETLRCPCEQKIECITNSIQILSLTLQELESKINLCFTKQASLQAEVCSYRCEQQSKQQEDWQLALKEAEKVKKSAYAQEEIRMRLKEIDQEVNKVKRTMSRFESKDSQKCLASKLLEHKFQKYKGQQENRVQCLLQSIDEIAHLQRKIMNGYQKQPPTFPDEQSSLISYPAQHSRKVRMLRGCSLGRNQTCQSTNISYSRNTDK